MTDINQGDFWVVDDRRSLEAFIKMMTQMYEEKKYLTLKIKGGKTRTSAQNNALHVLVVLGNAAGDTRAVPLIICRSYPRELLYSPVAFLLELCRSLILGFRLALYAPINRSWHPSFSREAMRTWSSRLESG